VAIPVRRGASRLAAFLFLGAGLVLGTGIGLPIAHWVSGILTATPGASTAAGHAPSPAPAQAIATPPATGAAVSSPTPTASPPVCAPLADGQHPLEPLRPPPAGYTASAALDWVACGDRSIPAGSGFTVTGSWLVAVSYTCPTGTAAAATGPTLIVGEVGALPGSTAAGLADPRGDAADLTAAPVVGPGTYRLSVAAASDCLWHLAVYRS
jgi:hypothetical protein